MRLNASPNSPDYFARVLIDRGRKPPFDIAIIVDGQARRGDVMEADDTEGWAEVLVHDAAGQPVVVLEASGYAWKTERIVGHVEFRSGGERLCD